MAKSRSLQQAVRFALATATAAAGVSTLHAQEAPAPTAPAAAPVEEVVVTGSRLSTPNETSISPITTVSAVDLQATGLTRVEDVLNNLPMVFAGMNSTTSNGGDSTASVDLRGLGNQRTLVLVNGLRLGPGQGGGRNWSDINQIPAALIERVDILTGGSSAVYGADAVAGVVNFILNTHFEGVRVDAGYHFNQHDNANQLNTDALLTAAGDPVPSGNVNTGFGKNASILVGSNFAENKGNATAYVTYDNQGSALQSKFDYSACTLNPATATTVACGGSSFAAKNGAGGRFLVSGTNFAVDNTVDGLTGQFRPFTDADKYNYGPINYYQTPNERWTAGAFVNYDVNSHVNLYTNVMYMRNSNNTQIAPVPVSVSAFIPCADPLLNASEKAVYCNATYQAGQGNPSEVYNGTNYPGLNTYVLRRNVEGGPRVQTFTSDAAREVAGVKGDFADSQNAWTYDVYAQHSTVDTGTQNLNYLSNSAVQQSLNVLPGGVCGGPSNGLGTGPLVGPNTPYAATPGCIPWNLWTANGVTPASVASMSVPEQEQLTVTEYVVDGSVTGDLGKYGVKLPTADTGLQMNIGAEWREDMSNSYPDYISQQGLAAGGAGKTLPVNGEFTVKEVFTELRLPLAQHQAFADDLSVEGGYRYSKYSEGFDTNTYKLGLEWAPVRDVRLRASYQRAVRAPNIGELYTPQAVGLDGSIDPCAAPLAAGSTTTLTTGATFAQCAKTGVTPAQFGHIIPNPSNQYNGLLGGNPNLAPETADTYTVGFVFQPRFVPNLTVSLDYFDIKIKDVIGSIGGNTLISDCLTSGQFCSNIVRAPGTGSLWLSPVGYVSDLTVNEGELSTKGIDAKASYRQPLATWGSLLFSLEGTYLKSLETTPVVGGDSYDCKGYFGATCGGGNPSWRSVLNATWSTPWAGLDLNLRWRYIGSVTSQQLNPSKLLATSSAYLPLSHIPAYSYLDLAGSFNLYKGLRLQLGVNNITDKVPPMVVGGDCSTSSGGGNAGANCNGNTYPGVYDAMGRYIFMNLTAQF